MMKPNDKLAVQSIVSDALPRMQAQSTSMAASLTRGFLWLFWCCCLMVSPVLANEFKQINLDESDYLLLDVTLQDRPLLSSAESYQSAEQTLLPASQLASALNLGIDVDPDSGKLVLINDDQSSAIELSNGFSSVPLKNIAGPYLWGHDGFELYVSHLLLEQIMPAKIRVILSRLTLTISSGDKLFPIEKVWQRQQQVTRVEDKEVKSYTLYVDDTYQLLTPPTANVSFQLNTQDDGLSHDTNAGYSVQTTSDILYHSAQISMSQNTQSDEFSSRMNFSRHQPSPDETLWGGLQRYSFGDISTSSQSLLNNTNSGLGLEVSRRPTNFSRSFGSKNIEGDATPGWEVELYRNGFLLERSRVPDNGHYLFPDVETDYGNNNFEIRLFGPYGEEEFRRENIHIGSNWLPKGEFAYDAYILDRNRSLLNSDDPLDPADNSEFITDLGFSVDYSPFNNTHIGSFYQQSRGDDNQNQHYFGTHSQSALSNMLLDMEFVKQQDAGHQLLIRGVGLFPWGQNYQLSLEERDRFSIAGFPTEEHSYQMRFSTGGVLPLTRSLGYRSTINYANSSLTNDRWSFSNRLSWRYKNIHFSNKLRYDLVQSDISQDTLSGETNISSTSGKFRLSGLASYRITPEAQLDRVGAAISWRDENTSYHHFNASFQPSHHDRVDDRWDLGYTYSINHEAFVLFLNSNVDSDQEWSFNLGVNFFLDYDAYNQRFRMSSEAKSASGNLNITAYLDRNNNDRRDEGDWTLEDVQFSPIPMWQALPTNHEGKVALPGVPVHAPFTFNGQWQDGVTTKAANYTIYTHPGSRVDIDIPFTVNTNLAGFAMIAGGDESKPLTSGNMELTNLNTGIKQNILIDIDGFYEINNLHPGHYALQPHPDDLQRLNMVVEQGQFIFVTPRNGGDYELPDIMLIRANSAPAQLPESTRLVLNELYGDVFYFGEEVDGSQIYSVPWEPRVAVGGKGVKRDFSQPAALNSAVASPALNQPPTTTASDEALREEASKNSAAIDLQALNTKPISRKGRLKNPGKYTMAIAPSSPTQVARQPRPKIQSQIQTQAPAKAPAPAPSQVKAKSATISPVQAAIAPNTKQTRYFVQVGAYGLKYNAQSWLQRHPRHATNCSISRSKQLYIIGCGSFTQLREVNAYRVALQKAIPGLRPIVKTLEGPVVKTLAYTETVTTTANIGVKSSLKNSIRAMPVEEER